MTDVQRPDDHLMPDDADLEAIAQGREPKPWRGTFQHPVHGDLQFTMHLPRAAQLMEHSVAMDNMLEKLDASPREGTMRLVAALAGLQTLMELPVVDRKEEESELSDVEERVTLIRYDPINDFNQLFPVAVWEAASVWRQALLDKDFFERLGKGSEPTPGEGSSTASDEPTASPSTTPA
jgi:hypothetical protein